MWRAEIEYPCSTKDFLHRNNPSTSIRYISRVKLPGPIQLYTGDAMLFLGVYVNASVKGYKSKNGHLRYANHCEGTWAT